MIKVELEPKWNKQACDDLLHIRIRMIIFCLFSELEHQDEWSVGSTGETRLQLPFFFITGNNSGGRF